MPRMKLGRAAPARPTISIARRRSEDLAPQDADLHLRQPVAVRSDGCRRRRPDAGSTFGRSWTEALRIVDRRPRRDCPRRTTSPPCCPCRMRLPPQLRVDRRRAPHMDHRCLIADHLRHQAGQQARVAANPVVLRRMVRRSAMSKPAAHRRGSASTHLLPPTISRAKVPTNSRNGMSCVAGPCAIIEIRSDFGAAAAGAHFHQRRQRASPMIAARPCARPRSSPPRRRPRHWRWRRPTNR